MFGLIFGIAQTQLNWAQQQELARQRAARMRAEGDLQAARVADEVRKHNRATSIEGEFHEVTPAKLLEAPK